MLFKAGGNGGKVSGAIILTFSTPIKRSKIQYEKLSKPKSLFYFLLFFLDLTDFTLLPDCQKNKHLNSSAAV
jgi:hypothetical protein